MSRMATPPTAADDTAILAQDILIICSSSPGLRQTVQVPMESEHDRIKRRRIEHRQERLRRQEMLQAEQAERDKEAEERRRVKAEERRQEREHRRQKEEEEKAKEVEEAKRKEAQREATLDEIADDLDQARKIRSSAMRQVRHVLEALAGERPPLPDPTPSLQVRGIW